MRLDNIKKQYQHELVPLTQQREILVHEIAELKAVRDAFLEETTVLNARNEELAQLSAQYARRMDTVPEMPSKDQTASLARSLDRSRSQRQPHPQQPPTFYHSVSSSTIGLSIHSDEAIDSKVVKGLKEAEFPTPSSKGKFMKWPGSKPKEVISPVAASDGGNKAKVHLEHTFQQLSVLRFTRCDHCGDKMWGSQLRCSSTYTR
jgi:Rho-type GTPase-activating protein 1/2